MRCSACSHDNPDAARFCAQCGAPLRPADDGERRQLTIVFSDLSGYTALNERVDPAEIEAAHTAREPLPLCNLYIGRARALVRHRQGKHDAELTAELAAHRKEAERLGVTLLLPALDSALA